MPSGSGLPMSLRVLQGPSERTGDPTPLQDFVAWVFGGALAVAGRDEWLEAGHGSRWCAVESGGDVILRDDIELRPGDVAVDGRAS